MSVQIDLTSLMDEAKAKKRYMDSPNSNYASLLGDPCLRYLVLLRIKGHERALYSVDLQYIFDEGRHHEEKLLRDLQDEAKLEIRSQQTGLPPNPQNIRGRIDGEIKDQGEWIPLEVKSMSPFLFAKLPESKKIDIMDFLKSKNRWQIHYPGQMNIYLLMNNKERGIMIFKNKLNGKIKQADCTLDYEYAELLLKKAEAIERHLKAGTLPDFIEDQSFCLDCDMYAKCLPPIINPGLMLDDPELEQKLDRRGELEQLIKPLKEEFDEIDEDIKAKFKEKEAVIGSWVINGKWVEKKGFEVKPQRYWQMKIRSIKKSNKA